jgi:hypothetical protein
MNAASFNSKLMPLVAGASVSMPPFAMSPILSKS